MVAAKDPIDSPRRDGLQLGKIASKRGAVCGELPVPFAGRDVRHWKLKDGRDRSIGLMTFKCYGRQRTFRDPGGDGLLVCIPIGEDPRQVDAERAEDIGYRS